MSGAFGMQLLCVAGAGAAGAVARWGLNHAAQQLVHQRWPVGTLVVNVLGTFLFGLGAALFVHRAPHDPARLTLLVGFCGGLTTFSSMAYDLHQLQGQRGPITAALNLGLHVGLGMAALCVGLVVGRWLLE